MWNYRIALSANCFIANGKFCSKKPTRLHLNITNNPCPMKWLRSCPLYLCCVYLFIPSADRSVNFNLIVFHKEDDSSQVKSWKNDRSRRVARESAQIARIVTHPNCVFACVLLDINQHHRKKWTSFTKTYWTKRSNKMIGQKWTSTWMFVSVLWLSAMRHSSASENQQHLLPSLQCYDPYGRPQVNLHVNDLIIISIA